MRGVCVLGVVGVLVVVAVVIGPPEGAALDGGACPEREEELARAGCAVGFVREIAVVNAGDCKHTHEVEEHGGPGGEGAHTHEEDAEATEVEDDERHDAHPIDLVGFVAHFFGAIGAVIGVNPLRDGGRQAAEKGGTGGYGIGHRRSRLKTKREHRSSIGASRLSFKQVTIGFGFSFAMPAFLGPFLAACSGSRPGV